ncbi:MAG: orotidine-5'-phosphate decarboxylase [Chloroflexi bacterium]|nr:orotidine-5'-phosphate decarboxylase [Chloroflexota bacterium]
MRAPFFTQVAERVRARETLLVVGLDPHPEDLPRPTPTAARDWARRLMDATHPWAAAFKPNVAFYGALGPRGFEALGEVIAHAHDLEVPVILDAKWGDIASSSRAYAQTAFATLGADAATVSPYLGPSAWEPFLTYKDRGIFVLVRTSNPDADFIQEYGGEPLYARLARRLAQLDPNQVGMVVGATAPDALALVRALAPQHWILAPGLGAQGGDPAQSVWVALREDGLGALFPMSRAISRAKDPAQAAREWRDVLNRYWEEGLKRTTSPLRPVWQRWAPALQALAEGIFVHGMVQFGEFILKSGRPSPIYIDLRRLTGYPHLMRLAAWAYTRLLRPLKFDRLAGIPYAGLPLATAAALEGGWPLIYPRKEPKAYGTRALVEGPYRPGEQAVLLDDLATTGEAKLEALATLRRVGLQVRDVVVLIDRQAGASETLAHHGLSLHAVFRLTDLLEFWVDRGLLSASMARRVRQELHLL